MCNQQSLRSACAYTQSDQSLCKSVEYSISVKLLTEHHLEFVSLKVGCTGSSESTLVKMPHCWKSYVAAQIKFSIQMKDCNDSPRIAKQKLWAYKCPLPSLHYTCPCASVITLVPVQVWIFLYAHSCCWTIS